MSSTIRGAVLLIGIAAAGCATAPPPAAPAPVHAHGEHGDSAHATMRAGGAARDSTRAGHPAAGHEGHDTARGGHQAQGGHQGRHPMPGMPHDMWMRPVGGGWHVMGMGQTFPTVTTSVGAEQGSPQDATEAYLTQTAAMVNLESPGSRVVLRTTLNFEGITQPDGELTFGGWGEGFLDRRHPHTLLHEAMLSVNFWDVAGGSASLSAGKGFAPYGTDDPMMRPALKYPTNHHLSQLLERWTASATLLRGGWSLEAGIFGGSEPEGPYDLSNVESFPDSWSARVARRFGEGFGPLAPWEVSASYATVSESHGDERETTFLANAAVRHSGRHRFGDLYAMAEASRSEPEGHDPGYWSLLGEAQLGTGRHLPYYRVEYATRPEYRREGPPGTEGFFRYDHDSHPLGATRWLVNTVGYGYTLTGLPFSGRPFVEVQHSRVREERGGITPEALFGTGSLWSLSAGFRVYLGGGPMRMGSYGVLDPMSVMHGAPGASAAHAGHGGG